jgi:hypothetical protein
MPVGPYSQDVLTRIINVQWGGEVIVVFVDVSAFDDAPAAGHEPIEDKATFLSSWRTPYQEAGFQPGYQSTAYSVSTGAGEFIKLTAPIFSDGPIGFYNDVFVFANDGNIDASLARAIAGTKLIMPAIYLIDHSESDLPYEMAPPGLLWSVELGAMTSGFSTTWKMRNGQHRIIPGDGDGTLPPNNMIQCYPLCDPFSGPFGGEMVIYSGYTIYAYRLDANGTDTVYGELLPEDGSQNIDPAWSQSIVSGFPSFRGIPFQDPPPLISQDLIT